MKMPEWIFGKKKPVDTVEEFAAGVQQDCTLAPKVKKFYEDLQEHASQIIPKRGQGERLEQRLDTEIQKVDATEETTIKNEEVLSKSREIMGTKQSFVVEPDPPAQDVIEEIDQKILAVQEDQELVLGDVARAMERAQNVLANSREELAETKNKLVSDKARVRKAIDAYIQEENVTQKVMTDLAPLFMQD